MESHLVKTLVEFIQNQKNLIPFILLEILKGKKACKSEKLKKLNFTEDYTEFSDEEEYYETQQDMYSCGFQVLQERNIIMKIDSQDFIQILEQPVFFEKMINFVGRPRGRGRGRGGGSTRGKKKKLESTTDKKTKKKDSNSSNDDSDFVEDEDDEDPDEKPKKRGRPPKYKTSQKSSSEDEEEKKEEEKTTTRKIIRRKAETKEEQTEDSKLKYFQFICENLVEWKEEKIGAKKKMLGKHFEQTKEVTKPSVIEKIEEEKVEIPQTLKIITSQLPQIITNSLSPRIMTPNQLSPQVINTPNSLSPIDPESPKSYKIPKKKVDNIHSPMTPTSQQEMGSPIFEPIPPELPIPHDVLPKDVLCGWYKRNFGNLPLFKETFTQEGVFSSVALPHFGITIVHQLPSKNLEIAENQSSLRAIEHLWKIRKQKMDQKFEDKTVNTQRMEWRPQPPQERFHRPPWNPPPPSFEKRFN